MFRVAFIGLGRAAQHHHWPHIRRLPNVEVVGGCDPDADARLRAREAWGLLSVFADPEELLTRTAPDVVNVCTPPADHARACLLALRHGAHVFCEKPFVESLEEADAVIAAAKAAGRTVVVNNQYRHMRIYEAAKRELNSERFGRLLFLHAWQRMYRTPATEGGWRGTLKQRTLFEFGTHVLDLIRFFYEADPVAVYAQMPRVLPQFEADLIDVVTLNFADGRIASIVLDRVYHGPERYLELGLDGERSSLRVSLDHVRQTGKAMLLKGSESFVLAEDDGKPWGAATGRHFARFLEALEGGQPPEARAEENRRVIAVCFAAYESAERGEVVHLGEGGFA